MSSFKLEYKLIQQTPLIHFQYDQDGATLRATEVKPKLDEFIIKKLGGIVKIDKNWLISVSEKPNEDAGKKTQALNYKMTINAEKTYTERIGRNTPYDIYYGNMGDNHKSVVNCTNITLSIVCFIEKLREAIAQCIIEFFAVTNFGTMKNRGFGSFLIKDTDKNKIPGWLKSEYGAPKCYCFDGGNSPFSEVKELYGIIKSGGRTKNYGYQRSLLFKYMHNTVTCSGDKKSNIDNEKAWLKQNGLAPAVCEKGHTYDRQDSNSKYVRALLGVGDHIDFLNGPRAFYDKTTVTIKNKEIERLESCIFFKIIKSDTDNKYTVYYIAKRINQEIYGKEFIFNAFSKKDSRAPAVRAFYPVSGLTCNQRTLSVPQKNELPADFIDDFMEYCFTELNRIFRHEKIKVV